MNITMQIESVIINLDKKFYSVPCLILILHHLILILFIYDPA